MQKCFLFCRVKVDCVAALNGYSSCADAEGVKSKKRRRDGGEEGQLAENKKKKKKKKKREEVEAGRSKQETVDRREASPGRSSKKKRKKEREKSNTVAPTPAAPPRKNPPSAPPSAGSNKKKAPAKTQSSSTESSSEESNCPKRTAARTAPPTPAASKTPPNTKPPQKNTRPPSSSSSETDSDGSTPTPKCPEAPSALKQTDVVQAAPPQDKGAEPADAGSEEEIQLVIRRPQQPNRHADGLWSRRGGGRGARGGAGGAAGRGLSGQNSDKEPPLQARSPTNTPPLLQVGPRPFSLTLQTEETSESGACVSAEWSRGPPHTGLQLHAPAGRSCTAGAKDRFQGEVRPPTSQTSDC